LEDCNKRKSLCLQWCTSLIELKKLNTENLTFDKVRVCIKREKLGRRCAPCQNLTKPGKACTI
jgi:hypothetical protein